MIDAPLTYLTKAASDWTPEERKAIESWQTNFREALHKFTEDSYARILKNSVWKSEP